MKEIPFGWETSIFHPCDINVVRYKQLHRYSINKLNPCTKVPSREKISLFLKMKFVISTVLKTIDQYRIIQVISIILK